jgi:triacylglycerol esterase/lipase EstA (alpha/beta hydrolase family)
VGYAHAVLVTSRWDINASPSFPEFRCQSLYYPSKGSPRSVLRQLRTITRGLGLSRGPTPDGAVVGDAAGQDPPPVVLVHGYLDSDRTPWWDVLTGYLTDAGWPAERVHRVEIGNLPGTTVGSPRAYARDVEAELERVHDAHGEPASVLCHSMGGLDTRWCVEQLDAAPLVDDVVTLGTPHRGTYAAYLGLLPRAAGSWSLVVTSSRS